MNQLLPGVRKLLVSSVLFVLIFALWELVFHPLWTMSGTAIERLHDAEFELNRSLAAVNERNKLSENGIALEEQTIRQHLQVGDSASTAIGFLQTNVNRLAQDSGLQLESMSTEPIAGKEPLTKLVVLLKSRGPEAALVKMLAAVESQPALMLIDHMTIVAQDLGQTLAGKPSIGVAVEMRITGYWARPDALVKSKP